MSKIIKIFKIRKKIVMSAGAPDQRIPPQSFLVRPEWIIQGHAVQSLMHLRSYPQALCLLPFWRGNV